MNQGRIWCVVHPTVGLPLLLGSVAITALIVHFSVLSHTTWFSTYWQGKAGRVAENTVPAGSGSDTKALAGYSMTVTPVPAAGASQASFIVRLAPTTTAVAPASEAAAATPGAVALR